MDILRKYEDNDCYHILDMALWKGVCYMNVVREGGIPVSQSRPPKTCRCQAFLAQVSSLLKSICLCKHKAGKQVRNERV